MNSVADSLQHDTTPWFRQFWPWALIALPLSAVIGCIITITLALQDTDGLVVDDYYKQGLAINQTLERDRQALADGITAQITLDTTGLRLTLTSTQVIQPELITLRFLHATRANQDVELNLRHTGDGVYQSALPALVAGRWHVQLESDNWRIIGDLHRPDDSTVTLAPAVTQAAAG